MPNATARPDDLIEAPELGNDVVTVYLAPLPGADIRGIIARDPQTGTQACIVRIDLVATDRRAVVAELLDTAA